MGRVRSRAFAAILAAGVLFLWLLFGAGGARADESPATDPGSSSAVVPDSSASSSSPADTPTGGDSTSSSPSPVAENPPGPSDTVVAPGPTSSTPVVEVSSSAGDSTAVPGASSSSGSVPAPIGSSTDSPPPPTAAQVAAAKASASELRDVVQESVPAIIDSVQSAAGGCAQCDAAIAVSLGGDSWAGAANPATTTGSTNKQLATTQDAASDAGAGSTGRATAVSISANGDATADAAPGAVGGTAQSSTVPAGSSAAPARAVPVQAQQLLHAITDLMHGLLDASGSAASSFQLSSCGGTSLCVSGGQASAQIATTAAGATASTADSGASCWSGGAACSIVVSIALHGTAHVSLPSGTGSAAAATNCTAASGNGSVGAANSIAVAVHGDAHASIEVPRSADCAPAATTQTVADLTSATRHSAATGTTGDALSIAMTARGTASSHAASGNSGQVSTGGAAATGGGNDTELARTGLTGDAVGVAIAKFGATSLVHSGNSGSATAICSGCGSGQAGGSFTQSISGDTGLSFVVAIAGRQASVQSQTGDSGQAISWVVDHSGSANTTQSPSTGSSGIQRSDNGGQVYVSGHSGETGNVIVIAVGPTSSVEVYSHTGHSGPVHSIATWGLGTCKVDIVAFQVVCPTAGKPAPGGQPTGSGSGGGDKDPTTQKQRAGFVKIVISPGDPGGPHAASASGPSAENAVAPPVSNAPATGTYQGGVVPAAAQQRSRDDANLVTRVALIAGAAILPTLLLLWWVISRGDGEAWPSYCRLRHGTDDQ